MLLTRQQRFILDTVGRLGCIRYDQLAILLRKAFLLEDRARAERIARAAARQLCRANLGIREAGNVLHLPRQPPDEQMLRAIDVMLLLTEGAPSGYQRGTVPVLLRFAVGEGKVRTFSVLQQGRGCPLPPLDSWERLIILANDPQELQELPLPNRQFFAFWDSDGKLQFLSKEKSSN